MTPRERIQEMDWLAFFGGPYIKFFGGQQRILKASCNSIKQLSSGFVLIAAARPDSPEMTDSSAALLNLEEYLGADAFAGRDTPKFRAACQRSICQKR
jgi:hypothetical protein